MEVYLKINFVMQVTEISKVFALYKQHVCLKQGCVYLRLEII
jgi:hypothetical protein